VSALTPGLAGLDAPVLAENPLNGIEAGCHSDLWILLELRADLPRAPAASLSNLEDSFDHGRRRGVRAGMRTMRAVSESPERFLLEAANPFVAGGSADAIPTAELSMREIRNLGLHDETGTFLLHG
jgi:hypothetical protein